MKHLSWQLSTTLFTQPKGFFSGAGSTMFNFGGGSGSVIGSITAFITLISTIVTLGLNDISITIIVAGIGIAIVIIVMIIQRKKTKRNEPKVDKEKN